MTSVAKSKEFSSIMVDALPDLHLVGDSQTFSLYTYDPLPEGELSVVSHGEVVDGYVRRENITDATLRGYRQFYEDPSIVKEDIFYYVYALLHHPEYKQQYAADLKRMLPRIPKVNGFTVYARVGRALADLHINYEQVDPYPLKEETNTEPPAGTDAAYWFYCVEKLRFGPRKDRSRIVYNKNLTLSEIPDEAYEYQVNGKSALEWIIDRYQVTTHKDSKITNDPNDYSLEVGNPRYIVELIERIVTVSLESQRLVGQLPVLQISTI